MGYLNCSTPEDLYDAVYACSKTIKSLKGFQAAKPGTFSGPTKKARSLSIGSVNTEDISRFYCLLRFIASKDRQGRKGKGIKEDTTIPFLDKVYPNMRVRLKKKNTVPVKALFKTSTRPPPPNKKELAM
ncbi:hypothetical protein LTR56_025783 [Elasticomyces elasticus]|nr:hypothetical protein LTR56_025783 [Elasticomyces elasticus]